MDIEASILVEGMSVVLSLQETPEVVETLAEAGVREDGVLQLVVGQAAHLQTPH
jgi:hypothetical protein